MLGSRNSELLTCPSGRSRHGWASFLGRHTIPEIGFSLSIRSGSVTKVEIFAYTAEHFEGAKDLWQHAFPDDPPWSAAEVAIPAKLAVQPDLFLVAVHQGKVVGTIMGGYDGHRGWLYAVGVLNVYRRRGISLCRSSRSAIILTANSVAVMCLSVGERRRNLVSWSSARASSHSACASPGRAWRTGPTI